MKAALFFSILFCCALIALAQRDSAAPEKIQSDEYQVYKTVLKEMCTAPITKQFVIRGYTSWVIIPGTSISTPPLLGPGAENVDMLPETFENYIVVNQKTRELKNEFDVDVPIILLTKEDFQLILDKVKEDFASRTGGENYRKFMEQRYKTDFIFTLSNIGFNKDGNQAFLYVEHFCGAQCGGGMYVLLEKENNNWIIKGRMPASIA